MTRRPSPLTQPRLNLKPLARLAKCVLVVGLIALPTGVIGGGAFGYSDAESLLLKALREIRLTQLDSARKLSVGCRHGLLMES